MISRSHRTPASALLFGMLPFLFAFLFSSCGKVKAPQVTEWALYQDPFYGFEIQYPKGWYVSSEANRLKIYSSEDAAEKFFDPTAKKEAGVEILFGFEKFKNVGSGSLEAYRDSVKAALTITGKVVAEAPTVLGKEQAVEVSYTIPITTKSAIHGKRILTARDSVFYYVSVAGFDDYYDAYRSVFDTVIASVKLPKPKTPKNMVDETKPSKELTRFDNEFLTVEYPDNFENSFPAKKGDMVFSVKFLGYRQDCTMQIDILPAKGLTVEKVFDQNKGKFNPKSTSDATIDNVAAKYASYSPMSKVDGRVYFAVKNDKVYRVVLTWYQPMQADYLPVFEKAVSSLKMK